LDSYLLTVFLHQHHHPSKTQILAKPENSKAVDRSPLTTERRAMCTKLQTHSKLQGTTLQQQARKRTQTAGRDTAATGQQTQGWAQRSA
jgi:hypothetical protein